MASSTPQEGQEIKRDRSWITVQKKTFTRWSNNFLKDRKMYIENLETDLSTGLLLINLLEIISAKEIGARYNKAPKMSPQKLENVSLCLKFIQNQGIKLVAIGPEDIVDGNLKLILGLIWTLILRFQIQRGGFEGKAELLEWVRKQVAPYGVRPNNFNLDWVDGKVLSALTDSLQPGVFPQDTWTGNNLQDIDKAQTLATEHYQIPVLIDAQDIVECPDELAMMTYISYFRDWWLDEAKRRARELEEERLRKMRTADPSQCYAHGPGLTGGTTNNTAPFTIQAVNYFGDPLPTGGDNFVIELNGPNGNLQVKQVDNNNGTYNCTYVPVDAGNYNLNITLRGDKIKGSPYKPVIVGPDSKTSHASGPGVEGARVNQKAPFTVHSKDRNGNNVPTGNDPFAVKVSGPDGAPVLSQFNDTKNGNYEGVYTPTKPGRYTVDITLAGNPIKGSPYHPLMELGNAGRSWAEGPGLTQGQTKKPCNFTIHSVDADGHPVAEGGDPFQVNITGPEKVNPKFTDNHNGTYDVVYSVETPGEYKIDITLHGQPIKDAPFHPRIKWSCDPSQCWADGEGLQEAWDNKPTQFTIHAVDYDGNPRKDGGDPFVVNIHSPAETIKADVKDNRDGTYTVSYAAQKPAPLTIDVTLEDQHIKDAPFHVECKSGTDPRNTGFKDFTFTIQTRDKNNVNKNFGGDEFVVKPSDPSVHVTTQDNQDGTYSAHFALAKKGNFSFRVSFNGHEIAASPLSVAL